MKKKPLNVETEVRAEMITIKMHADWCPLCKKMGERLTDLRNMFDQRPVLFVRVDYTNRGTQFHSKMLAEALGIDEIVRKNKSTGSIVLVDRKGRLQGRLTANMSAKEMALKIEELLIGAKD